MIKTSFQVKSTVVILLLSINLFNVNAQVTKKTRKLIEPQKVTKISYLLASGKGIGQSTFGHSYLRFSYGKDFSNTDITVEFVADVNPSQINIFKGAGLTLSNYDFAIVPTTYDGVYKYHVLKQDRDLTTYELKLSKKEILSITTRVNDLIINGIEMTYSFFTRNCADIVSDVIDSSVDFRLTGMRSKIPVLIPTILKKYSLIKSVSIDPRVSKLRQTKAERFFSNPALPKDNRIINIVEQLSSSDLNQRIYGIYKLNQYRLRKDLKKEDAKRLRHLGANLTRLEGNLVRKNMLGIFNGNHQSFRDFNLAALKTSFSSATGVKKTTLRLSGKKVYLVADLKVPSSVRKDGARKIFRSKKLIPNLTYQDGEIKDEAGNVVAYKMNDELIESAFYHPNLYFNSELIEKDGKKYVYFTLLWELKGHPKPRVYNHQNLISIDNGENGEGYCYSHSELTMLLNTRVIYDPKGEKLTSDEYLNLIKELYRNKIIVAPGVSSPMELTLEIDKDELVHLINRRHLAEQGKVDAIFNYFSETNIDNDNFYLLKNLINIGINPIVIFKVGNKGFRAHSVTITKIHPPKDGYRIMLDVIDPNDISGKNSGHQITKGQYWYNLKTQKLHTFTYGIVDIRIPGIDLKTYKNLNLILKKRSLTSQAIHTSRQQGRHSFYMWEFL